MTFIMYCDCIPKPKRDKHYPDCCSKCGGLYRGVGKMKSKINPDFCNGRHKYKNGNYKPHVKCGCGLRKHEHCRFCGRKLPITSRSKGNEK